jgi:hypothetical protein
MGEAAIVSDGIDVFVIYDGKRTLTSAIST